MWSSTTCLSKDIALALNDKVEARIAFIKGINGEQIELFERK